MHEMKLQKEFFNYIENGTKRIEIRLNDEKRQKIKTGDIIRFTNESNLIDTTDVKVTNLYKFKNFKQLISKFDISLLADKDYSSDLLIDTLNEFYSKDKQKEYGILAIEFELIKTRGF